MDFLHRQSKDLNSPVAGFTIPGPDQTPPFCAACNTIIPWSLHIGFTFVIVASGSTDYLNINGVCTTTGSTYRIN